MIAGLGSDNNMPISSGSFRQRSSGNKRLPWEDAALIDQNSASPKIIHTVAPLKAFPLNDELDFINSNSNGNLKRRLFLIKTFPQK